MKRPINTKSQKCLQPHAPSSRGITHAPLYALCLAGRFYACVHGERQIPQDILGMVTSVGCGTTSGYSAEYSIDLSGKADTFGRRAGTVVVSN